MLARRHVGALAQLGRPVLCRGCAGSREGRPGLRGQRGGAQPRCVTLRQSSLPASPYTWHRGIPADKTRLLTTPKINAADPSGSVAAQVCILVMPQTRVWSVAAQICVLGNATREARLNLEVVGKSSSAPPKAKRGPIVGRGEKGFRIGFCRYSRLTLTTDA